MIPININNSAGVSGIAEDCAGAATPQARDRMACPRGILEHMVDFFTFGAVLRENAKAYDEFAKAMTVALHHASSFGRNVQYQRVWSWRFPGIPSPSLSRGNTITRRGR